MASDTGQEGYNKAAWHKGPMTPSYDIERFSCKVDFLKKNSSWPEKTESVTLCETHLSCVFLTDNHAWKLKKPIKRNSFFDFSTREQRKFYCEEEVRLNRRLAPDVYLGVVPLTQNEKGVLSVDGKGEPVDWIVKMIRLPDDATVRDRLENGFLNDDDIDAVGMTLTNFFEVAERVAMSPQEYIGSFGRIIDYNYHALVDSGYDLPLAVLNDVCDLQRSFLFQGQHLLANRVRQGKIIEGHGDLRPEHIYLLDTSPIIIDCIEFNRNLRLLDIADELSFLQMACASFGSEDIGVRIFEIYKHVTGDKPHPALICFYAGVRALTRACLALLHLQEIPDVDPVKWNKKMRQYLELAQEYGERQNESL